MTRQYTNLRSLCASLATAASLSGCAGGDSTTLGESARSAAQTPLTSPSDLSSPHAPSPWGSAALVDFESYRDAARRVVNGKEVFNVEWDLFFSSEEDLLRHYTNEAERLFDDAAALQLSPEGALDKSVAITRANGKPYQFERTLKALHIRYCVSSAFGAALPQMVADLKAATSAWKSVAHVVFEYDASKANNCVSAASGVDFAVLPTPGALSACATPPYLPANIPDWCNQPLGTLVVDPVWPWGSVLDFYPNLTMVGVLRHELGHMIGLRHEHEVLPGGGGCGVDLITCNTPTCDVAGTPLTTYDVDSVMHYPQCNGNALSDLRISRLDGVGVRKLYGMPAAWYPPSVY